MPHAPCTPAFAAPAALRTLTQKAPLRTPLRRAHSSARTTPTAKTGGVLLCPGQGAQKLGMGQKWAAASPKAADVLEAADTHLGDSLGGLLSNIVFSGDADTLNRTDVAQPAIYATSMAVWAGLQDLGLYDAEKLRVVAGLSLGEYTALAISGAISFEDGLRLVTLRGRAMQDAADASNGGMVALLSVDDERAQEIADKCKGGNVLVIANSNSPGQVVLSGELPALKRVEEFAEKHAMRALRLDVAGAFHSPLMEPAAERLDAALADITIGLPNVPVCSNASGGLHVVGEIRQGLINQLTGPVRWRVNVDMLMNTEELGGADGVVWTELGPGKILSGIMRKFDRRFKVVNYDEPPVLAPVVSNGPVES